MNVNFWITPDEANRDAEGGGLVIFDSNLFHKTGHITFAEGYENRRTTSPRLTDDEMSVTH